MMAADKAGVDGPFAAAESLGCGFVHGATPYFYIENLDREVLEHMGLSPEGAEQKPDVYARVPISGSRFFAARSSAMVYRLPTSCRSGSMSARIHTAAGHRPKKSAAVLSRPSLRRNVNVPHNRRGVFRPPGRGP